MKNQDYCIGLDIGTSSTGYAMTDMNGRLLKHHKRSTFGAVLFDRANTAADRRKARSTRRRFDRKEQRIDLLQLLLGDDIAKQDPVFFMRLNESFLQADERKYPLLYDTLPVSVWADGSPFIMPDGSELLDINGHMRTYPTIYHLRHALIHSKKQADIRYIYLALHHIIKYRGHFLLEGKSLAADSQNIKEDIFDLLVQLKDYLEHPEQETLVHAFTCNDESANGIYDILQNRSISKSQRADEITKLLNPSKFAKPAIKSLSALLVGNKGSLKALLGYEGDNPSEALLFSKDDTDFDAYIDALGNNAIIFEMMLRIYRWQLFSGLREPGETISQTMIRRYEQHQRDLKLLKNWVRTYAKEQYDGFFRSTDSKNYCTYSGHYKQNRLPKGKKVPHCTQEDFYKALRALLNSSQSPDAIRDATPMLEATKEDNGFLPLLRINFNGAIPNQLHAEELSLIIDNQGQFYPTLLVNKDKIMSLCTFRLPYYVGPLNNQSPFAKWIKRDTTVKAYPWNLFDVVDKMTTAEGFISNLTNKCTYLPTEDVLPLHSLLYEEYVLLDELNRVTIKGKLIEPGLKNRIITSLFMQRKNVSAKGFAKWLRENSCYTDVTEQEIDHLHGADGFAASLRTYIDLSTHGFVINSKSLNDFETIIRWSTIFENRGILREKVETAYPQFSAKQIDYICRRRYTGWGRLSEKMLNGIRGELNHEPATLIEIMRQTNDNFMKIINDKQYGIGRQIEAQLISHAEGPITIEEVKALQGSPALKRGVWQATRIVEELAEHQGHAPTAIYIENTREEDDKRKGKRTVNRITLLESLYATVDSLHDTCNCKQLLQQCKSDSISLTDQQFLYFLQLGKCLYTEKPLDFNHLNLYQIDHIMPQSYIKDDSIDNRALVTSNANQLKRDNELLQVDVQQRMLPWWRYLHQTKINGVALMSDKKFHNLTRTHVSDHEKLGFINRQLVETSQIIKHVITLFKAHYPETRVEGINARLSSSVRDAYDLYKIRELNDTHHAFDAFLACTMGTFADKYFSWISDESVAASMARTAWLKAKDVDHKRINPNGIILGNFNRDQIDEETGEVLRDARKHIAYLKAVWGYKDHFIVRKQSTDRGEFYDMTKLPAAHVAVHSELKKKLPMERYGGYSGINQSYMVAITHQVKTKREGIIVDIPVQIAYQIGNDKNKLYQYLSTKYQNVKIIKDRIMIGHRIIFNNKELIMRSSKEQWNGRQLYLPSHYHKLLFDIVNHNKTDYEQDNLELNALIHELTNKLSTHYKAYDKIATVLNNQAQIIEQMSPHEKAHLVQQLLVLTHVNAALPNFSMLHMLSGLTNGRLQLKVPFNSSVILIDQSVTGFYERRTPLWDSEQF